MLLNHPRHWPGAHQFIVAIGNKPPACLVRKLNRNVAVAKLCLELEHEFLDHFGDNLLREVRESNGRVEPVTEFRREHLVDGFQVVALTLGARKAVSIFGKVGGARIRCHNQDDIAEIDLLAIVVGELAVIHDLQEHVEQIRMCLLDFVEQQHGMRMLINAVGQQAALVESDIAGRRADQARHRMPLHVLTYQSE